MAHSEPMNSFEVFTWVLWMNPLIHLAHTLIDTVLFRTQKYYKLA